MQQQVLAWETTPNFSFQYASDGTIILESDDYRASAAIKAANTMPGRISMPFTPDNIDVLEQFIQKVKAIKNGETPTPPTLSIAS